MLAAVMIGVVPIIVVFAAKVWVGGLKGFVATKPDVVMALRTDAL